MIDLTKLTETELEAELTLTDKKFFSGKKTSGKNYRRKLYAISNAARTNGFKCVVFCSRVQIDELNEMENQNTI